MPPKKLKGSSSSALTSDDGESSPPKQATGLKDEHAEAKANGASSRKRKAGSSTESKKAPRRSARGTANTTPDPVKVLKYLLSPSSLDVCRPRDEIEDLQTRGENILTYSTSSFTPFGELICATILSRPISHMLGLRSIRTIFNPPYEFTTPKKIREAGNQGCREALDKARTQHRQKTAEELVLLADAVVKLLGSGEEDVGLDRVREESDHDAFKERDMLKKHVKGLGKTGLNIFGRRIQGVWPEFYPFIDDKTLGALEKLGLPSGTDDLQKLIDKHWEELEVDDIEVKDVEEKKRRSFVRILERAVGAYLEGNIESVMAKVA